MDPFRITFNLPAVRKHFTPDEDSGLEIRLVGGSVFVRAQADLDGDAVVAFSTRGRGGAEATIEGNRAEDLFVALTSRAMFGPYFVLQSTDDGWLQLTPHQSTGAPPKFVPHMRLWPPRSIPRPILANDDVVDFETLRNVLCRAQRVSGRWETKHRRGGRRPKEVTEAKRLLNDFSNLSSEILSGKHRGKGSVSIRA